LDEIGELPKALQAKLLRFLESGEIRRVGDNQSFTCDVRVVCATNRHLDEMVAVGEFREDLWYRINTFEITLPPLREHLEDVPLLAFHLHRRYGVRVGENEEIFTPEAMELLCQHSWPGNVRELANVIEHAKILCERLPIGPEHLPQRFASQPASIPMVRPSAPNGSCANLKEMELQAINEALARNNGSKPKAAEELGISLKTLYNKLNQAAVISKSA
jgi:transcriptional regulator with PAS, ATPase and Fis domain